MELILTHTHGDFDAIGAMIGAKRLHPRAVVALPAQLNSNVQRFLGVYRDAFGMVPLATLDWSQVRRVILVDCHDLARTGEGAELSRLPNLAIECFDHHPPVESPSCGEVRAVGAATTLLATRLRQAGAKLSAIEATGMLLGVLEDTGRLTFPSTTPEDAEAIAYLLKQGARLDLVPDYLDPPLTPAQQELLTALMSAMTIDRLDDRPTLLASLDHATLVEGQSVVVERLMALYRPTVAVVAIRTGSHTQITARSADEGLSALDLLAPWGGGGHPTAASAHDETGLSPHEVVGAIRQRLSGLAVREPKARDLMSWPVRTLSLNDTARAALESLRQWGHTAMPIVHRGKVQGMVSRRDLDRAVHHGFGDRTLRGIAARRVDAIAPDAPLREIRRRLAEPAVGRLVVLDRGELVGIVTRSDLIRALEPARAPRLGHGVMAERIRDLWPADWVALIAEAGRIAGDRPLYLVGGAVRDLLLDRPSFDLDLLVPGDAIALARDLARGLKGKLKIHEAFGTAHLELASGKHLDLASARVEHYPSPGALPVVSPATVEQDLSRRDFTINALAMRLNPDRFGEVLDFFGGLEDLERGVIRILHPISFIEDPVRLFRAVRFEQKLGFRMASETEGYGRFAFESGRFDGMANERLKLELKLDFSLPRLAPFAERVETLDAWRIVHPALRLVPRARRALGRLDHLARWRPAMPEGEAWILPLSLILWPLDEAARDEAIAPWHLTRRDRTLLDAAWHGLTLLPTQPGGWDDLTEADLTRQLAGLPDAALWVMAAAAPEPAVRARLRRETQVIRHIRLERIDGSWLVAQGLPPGPRIGAILSELLEAKRAGTLPTPEAEEAMARRLIASDHPVS